MRYSKVHIFVVSLLFFQFPLFVFGSDDSHDSGVIVENPHPPPPPPPPTRSKDLKQIIRELEESDYGGYGSWGNFQIRREFREKKSKDLDEQRRRQSLLERDSRWSKGGDEHYSVGNAASEEGDNEERRQLVPSFSSSSSSKEVEGKSQLADYYKPQNSRELMLLLDKASLRREAAADSSRIVSVASFARLASLFLLLSLSSFLAVAPRQLPTELYNLAYKANLLRVMGTLLWPAGILLLLFRHEDADVNLMITTFTSSFLFSYPSLCLLEKIIATCIRLAILSCRESMVFQLHPEVPSIHLPWMLRQLHYLPRKSSLVLFLVCNYCIMAPIVEETFKAFLLRRVIVRDAECRRKKKRTKETVEKTIAREISVRGIVIYSLAIALGIKSADTARRVLLYSAPSMRHKTFFALARSVYPVQEICSVLTALNYAKSISLVSSSSFNASSSSASPLPGSNKQKRPSQGGTTLFRSILLHAMATMRGMKPLYVWDSRRPWDEIQLQAWNAIDVRSPLQMLCSSALNLLWFGALFKYVQVAIKKYVRLSQKFYNRKLDDAFGKLSSQRR